MWKRKLLERARSATIPRRIWMAESAAADAGNKLAEIVKTARVTTDLIRVGSEGDGGYLIPDDLEGIDALLSPGVSTVCDFDLAFAKRGIPVFMADASVDAPPISHENFHFQKKFIDIYDSDQTIRFSTWFASCDLTKSNDLVLQMDVERAEYRIISSIPDELLLRFRIIIVEFHNVEEVFSAFSSDLIIACFKKLTRYFNIVHIHPNNNDVMFQVGKFKTSPTMEFTFYRKDRPFAAGIPKTPHPLDVDCVPSKPSVTLSATWG
ncbi:MAG: hypothetical protein HC900_10780 [Methylacidiphilales bacterium]|nr:hypothetical protein [Candidatus Methylacidiphilales bacterium]